MTAPTEGLKGRKALAEFYTPELMASLDADFARAFPNGATKEQLQEHIASLEKASTQHDSESTIPGFYSFLSFRAEDESVQTHQGLAYLRAVLEELAD